MTERQIHEKEMQKRQERSERFSGGGAVSLVHLKMILSHPTPLLQPTSSYFGGPNQVSVSY
jgi:hypothetical protein